MKLKEIYKENLKRKYRNIVNIKETDAQIQVNPFKIIWKHKYPILIVSVLIILLLLFALHKTLDVFFIVIVFLIFCVGLSIFFNNYTINCEKDKLLIKWNFQKFELPYSHLKSIFLSKEFSTSELIPMVTYNIVILYIDNMNFIRELSFPALLLNTEELKDFLNNFIIEDNDAEDCIKYGKYQRFKKIMKSITFIIFIILMAVAIYASFK